MSKPVFAKSLVQVLPLLSQLHEPVCHLLKRLASTLSRPVRGMPQARRKSTSRRAERLTLLRPLSQVEKQSKMSLSIWKNCPLVNHALARLRLMLWHHSREVHKTNSHLDSFLLRGNPPLLTLRLQSGLQSTARLFRPSYMFVQVLTFLFSLVIKLTITPT